jgi:hypothetical protein
MQELMVVRKWPAIEGHHARSKTDQRRSNQKLSKQNLNLPAPSIASRPLCLCGEIPLRAL